MSGTIHSNSPSIPIHNNEIPTLNGLRGMACLLVLYTHLGEEGWGKSGMEIGSIGVLLFFTLSGFLMAYHYLPGGSSLRYWMAYLVRRVFKVYPAYCFTVIMAWYGASNMRALRYYKGHEISDLLMLENLNKFLRPFWTIEAEMKFYFYFCILGMISALLKIPRHKLFWLWLAILSITTLAIIGNFGGIIYIYAYFFSGVLAGVFYTTSAMHHPKIRFYANLIVISYLVILLTYIGYNTAHQSFPFKRMQAFLLWQNSYGVYFAPFYVLFLLSVVYCTGWVQWLFSNPVMHFLGTISYSLYLSHIFIIYISNDYNNVRDWIFFILLMAEILGAAILLQLIVEKPFNSFGKYIALKITS